LTVVYGPIDARLKFEFWSELRHVGTAVYAAWFICGDFNSLRFRHEKSGSNFVVKASKRFNAFIEDFNLFEYELSNRKYI
jgi:hypothetical protein